jgi:hypothetical protein
LMEGDNMKGMDEEQEEDGHSDLLVACDADILTRRMEASGTVGPAAVGSSPSISMASCLSKNQQAGRGVNSGEAAITTMQT